MMLQDSRIIFIFGYGRSGTTLLNSVLMQHPKIYFISVEFNELPWFYHRWQYYQKRRNDYAYFLAKEFFKRHHFPNVSQPDISSVDWAAIKNFSGWLERICDFFRQASGKPIIGIKVAGTMPRVIRKIIANIEMIKADLPDTLCVHIVRDPRDVMLSMKKMKNLSKFLSPYYFGHNWVMTVSGIRSLAGRGSYHEVRYEDLISQPGISIRDICNFLGISFDPQMLKFYQTVHYDHPQLHPNLKSDFITHNYNKWKTVMPIPDQQMLLSTAASMMISCGYDTVVPVLDITPRQRLKEYGRMAVFQFFNAYFFFFLGKRARQLADAPFMLVGSFLKRHSPPLYRFLKKEIGDDAS